MPAERRPGMDHEHYQWSPMHTRAPLTWPDGQTLTVCVLVSLNHMEWEPSEGNLQAHNLAGGLGRRKAIDYARLTHREYGHRVGIFRVLDVLEKHQVPVTLAMDALTADHYPYLVRHCLDRGAELVGHGISASQMISSRMDEATERTYIRTALSALQRASGERPRGWLGTEYGESVRTPALLAAEGIEFVFDWVNDEQPYEMTTPSGELYSLPIMLELDDVHALWDRRISLDRYQQLLVEATEVLARDGATNARSLVVHLHPWLIGQPFRIGVLDRALGEMLARPDVTAASASTVIEWTRQAGNKT